MGTRKITAFCQRHHIRKMALFGSVLRDDFNRDSDIDVLIEFETEVKVGLLALIGMQQELSELFHRSVDLVLRDGLKPLIRDEVLDSAQMIYASRKAVLT